MRGQISIPQLNADAIAVELLALLRTSGVLKLAHEAGCVVQGLDDVAQVYAALSKLVTAAITAPVGGGAGAGAGGSGGSGGGGAPGFGFGGSAYVAGLDGAPRPLRPIAGAAPANSATYLWYASWLLDQDVWISADQTQILKADPPVFSGLKTDTVLSGSSLDLHKFPQFQEGANPPFYTFAHVSVDSMEAWAERSAWIADFLQALLNLLNITKGDIAANVSTATMDTGHGIFKLAEDQPFRFWLEAPHNWGGWAFWLDLATIGVPVFGGSFENMHTAGTAGHNFLYWFTSLAARILHVYTNVTIASTARNFFLSFLTLLNYSGSKDAPSGDDNRAENRKTVDGVVDLVMLLFKYLMYKVIPRSDYVSPFYPAGFSGGSNPDWGHFARMWLLHLFLTNSAFGLFGAFVGTTIAEIIAWAEDWSLLGRKILENMPWTAPFVASTTKQKVFKWLGIIPLFWLGMFALKENDTGGGTYNPVGSGSSNDFAGYPDQGSSPYKLPWASSKAYLCSQGNQGMWSHNNFSSPSQVYAYDLALDFGDEILAARSGTVVDYFDWVPDNTQNTTSWPVTPGSPAATAGQTTSDNWNFICIRHDQAGDPIKDQDRGPGGAAGTTFAVYGHGQTNGVRACFAKRGVAPGSIIGTVVTQGQPIMLAGSTGNSFHDHVHIEVRQIASGSALAAPPIPRGNLAPTSIPFVFRDVSYVVAFPFKSQGVPRSLNFYTSDNQRVGP